MQYTFKLTIDNREVTFPAIERCPICHHEIWPEIIHHHTRKFPDLRTVTVFFHCPKCTDVFAARYDLTQTANLGHTGILESISPKHFKPSEFEQSIDEISPRFVKIYNQAFEADERGLDEICGMAYRKALEFLIKDYLCIENPEEVEKIKSMTLSSCINTYIDNVKIKTLAERSAWLGNDETHYVRKHTDYNVNDLKKFINALVHYISMEITVKKALDIPKK